MTKAEARKKRGEQTKGGRCVPFFVVAEGTSRRYGGSEEGGWWYDETEALDVFQAWTWRQALALARQLKQDWPTCSKGRYSAIGGVDVDIRLHYTPETIPGYTLKPRYE